MEIEEILNEVPFLNNRLTKWEALGGGLSNQTYKATADNNHYVLRINGEQNKYLNLTRSSEVEVMKSANLQGFAPQVAAGDDAERYIVTEFIEGGMVTYDDLQDKGMQALIILHLKKIHAMHDHGRHCTPFHLIESYLKGAERLGVKFPDGLTPFLHRAEEITHKRSSDKEYNGRFCHNDFFACNLIYADSKLQIIDWELSGSGDVFLDLATIPFSNQFTKEQDIEWLKLYFGNYEEEQYSILQDMKFMSMVRTCVWGVFFSGLDPSKLQEFDYYGHSLNMIERLQAGIYLL